MTSFPEALEGKGRCQQKDVDQNVIDSFFAPTSAGRKRAKQLCFECPVRLECLSMALERKETWGVWGGCDEVDLRRTLRVDTNGTDRDRQRMPRCPACQASCEELVVSEIEIHCTSCTFTWESASTAKAVLGSGSKEADKKLKQKRQRSVAKRPIKTGAVRARIPQEQRAIKKLRSVSGASKSVSDGPIEALAASAGPIKRK